LKLSLVREGLGSEKWRHVTLRFWRVTDEKGHGRSGRMLLPWKKHRRMVRTATQEKVNQGRNQAQMIFPPSRRFSHRLAAAGDAALISTCSTATGVIFFFFLTPPLPFPSRSNESLRMTVQIGMVRRYEGVSKRPDASVSGENLGAGPATLRKQGCNCEHFLKDQAKNNQGGRLEPHKMTNLGRYVRRYVHLNSGSST
jgi:hypothetical protein